MIGRARFGIGLVAWGGTLGLLARAIGVGVARRRARTRERRRQRRAKPMGKATKRDCTGRDDDHRHQRYHCGEHDDSRTRTVRNSKPQALTTFILSVTVTL